MNINQYSIRNLKEEITNLQSKIKILREQEVSNGSKDSIKKIFTVNDESSEINNSRIEVATNKIFGIFDAFKEVIQDSYQFINFFSEISSKLEEMQLALITIEEFKNSKSLEKYYIDELDESFLLVTKNIHKEYLSIESKVKEKFNLEEIL